MFRFTAIYFAAVFLMAASRYGGPSTKAGGAFLLLALVAVGMSFGWGARERREVS